MSIDFVWLWWFLTWWSVQLPKDRTLDDHPYTMHRAHRWKVL